MRPCPVAYDHDDDLGHCAVCGWTVTRAETPDAPVHPDDMPTATGPDRVAQAIARDRGGWPPRQPVRLCGPDDAEVSR